MSQWLGLNVIEYVAREVAQQGDGPADVWHMCRAWFRAQLDWRERRGGRVTPELIERWGMLVDPEDNSGGFRKSLVWVGDRVCPSPVEVPERMRMLCKTIRDDVLTPDDIYREFQLVHPFRDGNGRVGKILFNYLLGTLQAPVMPSDWFNCANP